MGDKVADLARQKLMIVLAVSLPFAIFKKHHAFHNLIV
jgi:hypothetical protein